MPGPREPRGHVKFTPKGRKAAEAPDEASGGPRKPEIKLSERPRESNSKLWLVVGLMAVVGMVAYAVASWAQRPDPHYVAARGMVDRYEMGREATSRNYNNPVYDEALAELELVDPESISVEPARELKAEILHAREAFLAHREQSRRQRSTQSEQRWEFAQRNAESHERQRQNPVTDYPECEDEAREKAAQAAHDH